MIEAEVARAKAFAGGSRRYDGMSMTIHWLTLLLLISLFGSMWLREQVSDGDTAALLLSLHRSAGVVVWIMTLGRLVWKAQFASAPALPWTMPRAQQWAARINEYTLYLLLFVQPVTGFVQSVARGKPFALFGLDVPPVMARSRDLTHLFHDVHQTSATALLVLVGLHAAAALLHALVLRDGVLRAMLPARERPFQK